MEKLIEQDTEEGAPAKKPAKGRGAKGDAAYRYVGRGNRDGIPARDLTEADLESVGRAYIEATVDPNTGKPMYEKV